MRGLGVTGLVGSGAKAVAPYANAALQRTAYGAGSAVRAVGAGGAAGIAGSIGLAIWTAIEAKNVSTAGRDFAQNMHMTKNGWVGGNAKDWDDRVAREKNERTDDLIKNPGKYKKDYLDAPAVKKMIADRKKETEGGKEQEHVTPIYHTQFGAVDKLWEQMQAMATENPAEDTATKQLDVLGAIALTCLNILEWLEGVPQTTQDEALKA